MKKLKLREMILAYLGQHGECSIEEVAAALGREVPAAEAARVAHQHDACQRRQGRSPAALAGRALIRRGQRLLVNFRLTKLVRDGKVVRVRRGVYATPRCRLYDAG